MEYYWAVKRNELLSHEKTWRSLKYILLSQRNQSERLHTVWLYVALWKKHISGDHKKISGWQGCKAQRIFRAVKILLYDIIMMDTCHCTFVQDHRTHNIENEPYTNYGLRVLTMCHCRFINCNKCTTPMGDADNRETMHIQGQGCMGNLCTLPSFCCKP